MHRTVGRRVVPGDRRLPVILVVDSTSFPQVVAPVIQRSRKKATSSPQAPLSLPGPQYGDLGQDDAFATILAWLHSRIETPSGG